MVTKNLAKQTQAKKKPPEIKDKATIQKRTAICANNASLVNACVVDVYGKATFGKELDILAIEEEIKQSVKQVNDGNLNGLEAMLVGQSKALQMMFMSLARRADASTQLKQYQTFMNLALKAQSQSRSTIEAVVALKYPKQVIVAKQANISSGAQQVNNGVMPSAPQQQQPNQPIQSDDSSPEKKQTEQNELLEHPTDEQTEIE